MERSVGVGFVGSKLITRVTATNNPPEVGYGYFHRITAAELFAPGGFTDGNIT